MRAKYLVVALLLFSAVGCHSQVPIQVRPGQASRRSSAAMVKQAFEYASKGATSDDRKFYELFKRKLNELAGEKPSAMTALESDPTYLKNLRAMAQDAANGKLEPNVVGGNPTPSGEFRDCVAITVDNERSSGVLIGWNVIATAAHCVSNENAIIRVHFGTNIERPDATYPVARANVHIYPGYDASKKYLHDLAILILSSDVNDPKPCPIAEPGVVDSSAYVRLAGFGIYDSNSGKNGVKHDVSVAVTSPACAKSREDTLYGCHKERELIAGKPLVGKDTCNGDSGGPAYVSKNNQWYVGSITSRPTDTAKQCGDGGIYVRIDREPYRSWIRSVPGAHW